MKGKVLGFDAAAGTGAITGDDGKRYAFVATDNKSPGALKPGDTVDFQVEGDAAKDIYAVAAGASVDLSAMAGSPAVANILAKPNVIWAALIILGSLIGGYFSTIELIGGGPMGVFGVAGFVLSLLVLVPVTAGVLIFFELTNHRMTAQFRMITAAVAIAGPILLPILAGMLLGVGSGFGGMGGMGGFGLIGFRLDLGTILAVGGGVLIVLTQMGVVKLPTKLG
jgi:cold shock CspA family protein